jgi:hypothetical protein
MSSLSVQQAQLPCAGCKCFSAHQIVHCSAPGANQIETKGHSDIKAEVVSLFVLFRSVSVYFLPVWTLCPLDFNRKFFFQFPAGQQEKLWQEVLFGSL